MSTFSRVLPNVILDDHLHIVLVLNGQRRGAGTLAHIVAVAVEVHGFLAHERMCVPHPADLKLVRGSLDEGLLAVLVLEDYSSGNLSWRMTATDVLKSYR